ncbi:MAG: S24 family peptidase [Rhodospirillales bacterium]|nr:S24 family peptidase [Rhodospirillales bacterium]
MIDSSFSDRLKQLIGQDSVSAFALKCGLKEGSVRQYLSGSIPGLDKAAQIAAAMGVPLDWLARGEGPVRIQAGKPTVPAPLAEGFVMVPRYNVEASAGHGVLNGHEHVVDYMAFREDFVRRVLRAEPGNLALINAVGDSMEPAIRAGDLLLIDRGIDRIMDDAIYILGMGDELVVKRVQRFFDGGLSIKSDNVTYREQTIAPADTPQLRVAGRVRWIGRLI